MKKLYVIYPSPFAESREAGQAVQTGIIRTIHSDDEALRRRMNEIAAELANLLETLEAAKE